MKKYYATLAATIVAASLNAQTTGLDFTADDCDGLGHTLFTELEAGNAVILEFVMMGCLPCVTASNSITTNVLPNTSDPSRVKFYSIGFTNSITCAQMNNWKTTNGLTHTVFAGMSAQTTHYGGMGMPTIAVLGGADHEVFYSEQGHSNGENPAIIAAIEEALSATVGLSEVNGVDVGVSPNPATDVITVSSGTWISAIVVDMQGRQVHSAPLAGGKLDIAALDPGAYVLDLLGADGTRGIARFEKQ